MKANLFKNIFLAIICMCIIIPFSFTNDVYADSPLSVSITISDSEVYWRDDTEDDRYQIGTVYVSINSNYPCTSLIYLNFGTSNAYAVGNIGETSLYSLSGANCQYVEPYVESGTEYGQTWRVSWLNLTTCIFVYEYKILKTVNSGTHGPIDITYLSMDINDGNMLPSREGLLIQEFELHFLNSNLNQQDIIDLLEQQNQNYLPTIIDMLQQIHGAIQTSQGNDPLESFLYAQPARVVSTVGSYVKVPWTTKSYYGDGFTIENEINIKAKYDGYMVVYLCAYFWKGTATSTTVVSRLYKNNVLVQGSDKQDICTYSKSITSIMVIPVQENDYISVGFYSDNYSVQYWTDSSILVEYISKDSSLDYSSVLGNILQQEMLINQSLQDIKNLIPTDVQQENITNINTELNIYNEDINTITNNYNNQIDIINDQLDFQDLVDIDPESENNILNSVNYYNTVFNRVISIPHMKSILIFLLLCILIVALVG